MAGGHRDTTIGYPLHHSWRSAMQAKTVDQADDGAGQGEEFTLYVLALGLHRFDGTVSDDLSATELTGAGERTSINECRARRVQAINELSNFLCRVFDKPVVGGEPTSSFGQGDTQVHTGRECASFGDKARHKGASGRRTGKDHRAALDDGPDQAQRYRLGVGEGMTHCTGLPNRVLSAG